MDGNMPKPIEKPKHSDFVSKIVNDPKSPPATLLLQGFVGRASKEDHTRIYFDPQLSSYVDVPNEAILHSKDIPPEQSPLGGSYVWINPNAQVEPGAAQAGVRAGFLQGPIMAAITLPAECQPTVPPQCLHTVPPVCHPTVSPPCHLTLLPICHPTAPPQCHPTVPAHCPTVPQVCGHTVPPMCLPTGSPPLCTSIPICHPTLVPQVCGHTALTVCHPTLPPQCHTVPPVCLTTISPLCHTVPPACIPTLSAACHTSPPICLVTNSPVCHLTQICPVQTAVCPSVPCPSGIACGFPGGIPGGGGGVA